MQYLVVDKKKKSYGPIFNSLIRMGKLEVKEIDEVKPDDEIIIFHNRSVNIRAKKKAWWMCDLRNPKFLDNGAKFDLIFLCNKKYLKEYEETFGGKAIYMPQCGDESPILKDSFWDVIFIGDFKSKYHQNRKDILIKIAQHFNLKIISGQGYNPENKYLYRDIPISLSISPQIEGYTSNRLYNILTCGGFCLSLYYPGIEDQFKKGVHLDWFNTPEEAVKLIKYYLEHSKTRKKIAKAGQELYFKKHTAEKRLEKMLFHINNLPD